MEDGACLFKWSYGSWTFPYKSDGTINAPVLAKFYCYDVIHVHYCSISCHPSACLLDHVFVGDLVDCFGSLAVISNEYRDVPFHTLMLSLTIYKLMRQMGISQRKTLLFSYSNQLCPFVQLNRPLGAVTFQTLSGPDLHYLRPSLLIVLRR